MPETPSTLGVLFVCAGNICRSPLAEGIFLHQIAHAGVSERFRVDSAGTGAWHIGHRPDRRSLAAAGRRGIDLPSLARQVNEQDFVDFDFILCMDEDNLSDLLRRAPSNSRARIELIRRYDATSSPDAEVPDPYYGGEADFEAVYHMLHRACAGFIDQLKLA